jgi:hypothetical protein
MGADEWIVYFVDDGSDVEEVIEHGFSGAICTLDPGLILRLRFFANVMQLAPWG